jgi:hypothetical protein
MLWRPERELAGEDSGGAVVGADMRDGDREGERESESVREKV